MNTVAPEQLKSLTSWGYSGEGDLESIIAWLAKDLKVGSEIFALSMDWHSGQWLSYIETAELTAKHGKGDTPLAAVFNLARAIHGKTELPQSDSEVAQAVDSYYEGGKE